MSDKTIQKVTLVVDASVARAAGGFESRHPIGMMCREMLLRIRGICHRMAWGENVKREWDKHQSNFAATWLVTMMSMNKLIRVDDTPFDAHQATIQQITTDPNVAEIMNKDAHLLAAAIRTGQRIVCLDDKVRGHFARTFRADETVMAIIWVNPTIPEEEAVAWLENGASSEAHRTLVRMTG